MNSGLSLCPLLVRSWGEDHWPTCCVRHLLLSSQLGAEVAPERSTDNTSLVLPLSLNWSGVGALLGCHEENHTGMEGWS